MFDASDDLSELSDALRALDEANAEIARLRERVDHLEKILAEVNAIMDAHEARGRG